MQKSFFQHKDAHDCPHRDTPCLPLFLITISSFCGYRSMTALFYRNVFLSINLFHLIAPIPIYLKLVIALAIFQIFVSFPKFFESFMRFICTFFPAGPSDLGVYQDVSRMISTNQCNKSLVISQKYSCTGDWKGF